MPRRSIRAARRVRPKLAMERLEPRLVMATFTVTTAADAGPGSLREAIGLANATAGADTIAFNLPGNGGTIATTSPLPAIAETVLIDGFSQPGSAPNLSPDQFGGVRAIRLLGSGLPPGLNDGLTVAGGGTTIRGLAIEGFSTRGIVLGGSGGHVVEGCLLFENGTGIEVGSSNNRIGGTSAEARNLISGNRNFEVAINRGEDRNLVQGNFIGIGQTGLFALGNGEGIDLGGADNTIGGTAPGARNVISGNNSTSIYTFGTRNLIQGNAIGVDPSGTRPLPNGPYGMTVNTGARNTIGGTARGAVNPDPTDRTPPRVVSVLRRGLHFQPTRLVVAFDEALDPARAQNPRNFVVTTFGPDGRPGTRDDVRVRVRWAYFDLATRQVTLETARRIPPRRAITIRVRDLTDLAGNLLDGDRDGRPGGEFVGQLGGERPAVAERSAALGRKTGGRRAGRS